jgi:hypothetical protein
MPTVASIKGSVLAGHAEVVTKYLASHKLSPDELARRFEQGEIELLARPISMVGWYSVGTYQRVLEFLRDYPGKGSNDYLLDAGARSAEALIRGGFYQQLEYLKRTQVSSQDDPAERFQAFGRDLRLMTTITQSIVNFVNSTVQVDPEHANRWMIVHQGSAPYPVVLCWTSQGFCNRMAEEHSHPDLWRWERPLPELVKFRMQYSL